MPLQCYSWQCHSNLYIFNRDNNNNNNNGTNPHKQQLVPAPILDTEQVSQLLVNDGHLTNVCQSLRGDVELSIFYLLNKLKHSGLRKVFITYSRPQYCVSRIASLHDGPGLYLLDTGRLNLGPIISPGTAGARHSWCNCHFVICNTTKCHFMTDL